MTSYKDNENIIEELDSSEEVSEEINKDELADAVAGMESTGDNRDSAEMTLEEQVQDLEDRNLRLLAEMQNLRNRHQKDMKEAREYAIAGFAQDMLTILENLNRAKENIPDQDNEIFHNLLEGIDLVREEVIRTFGNHGINRIAPKPGDDFDYKIHQALVQIPTNEFPDGKVVQLISAGYTIKDRILKPAMVGVAKAVSENDEEQSA